MSLKSLSNFVAAAVFFLLFSSCGKYDLPSIGDHVAFPGAIVAFDNTHFLMLNTNANGDYADGSIQRYTVNSNGDQTLTNSFSVPSHGSEIAVSNDRKLVALAFDAGHNSTEIQFYDYTDPANPHFVNSLSLKESGGRQAVKRLKFFQPSSGVGAGYYYIYGEIISDSQNDGSFAGILPRVFAAKISNDYSASSVLFYLSYGLGDPKALAPKTDANVPNDYSFGSTAPTYDADHNLFIAFPTGSTGGLSGATTTTPATPNVYCYFNNSLNDATNCKVGSSVVNISAMDMRVKSMIIVDFTDFLQYSVPINNSTYFVPLAWNTNGVPYGANTNDKVLNFANNFDDANKDNLQIRSLNFQTGFYESYWLNTPSLGSTTSTCYPSNVTTTSTNAYSLNTLGGSALLVTKTGINSLIGESGNEVFEIGGLDVVWRSVSALRTQRGAPGTYTASGENDFKNIASLQILDPYNTYYSTPLTSTTQSLTQMWTNKSVSIASPITPYMYSRVTDVEVFNGILPNAAIDLNVLNFGTNDANQCLPYWIRDTNVGFGGFGVDSAWLSSSPVPMSSASDATKKNYADSNANTSTYSSIDPIQPSVFSFPYNAGAERCTNVSPVANTPLVFCSNFLSGTISHFKTSHAPSTTTFSQ